MTKSFLSSVLTVAGGTAVAQAISLVSLPFITRLYPPEIYGAFVVFLAYGGFVTPIVCARFDVAIALPKRNRGAAAVALGSLVVAAGVALMTALLLLVLSAWVPFLGDAAAWCLPLYIWLGGALLVFSSWSARMRTYSRLSWSRIAQAAATAGLAICLVAATDARAALLVIATVAGQVVGLAVLIGAPPEARLGWRARPHQVVRLLRHFRRLAAFNVPHVLSDAAQGSGLPLLVAAFFGTQATAYYAFSVRLLKAPLGLVSGAVSQVYYPRAAAHRDDNRRLRHDALRILAVSTPAALLLLPLLLLTPERVFAAAFGPAWRDVGSYLHALAPWILSSFVAAPLSVLYLVKEQFALDFYLGLAGSVIAFSILCVARLMSGEVMFAMWALSLGMTVYVVASTVAEFRYVIGRGGPDA